MPALPGEKTVQFELDMNQGFAKMGVFSKHKAFLSFDKELTSSLDWPEFFEQAVGIINAACEKYGHPEQAFTIVEAAKALRDAGYTVEMINTSSKCYPAYMVETIGDTVLLNSSFFHGRDLFLEIKRKYLNADPLSIQKTLLKDHENCKGVGVYEWKDGSISFKILLDTEDGADGFAKKFIDAVHRLQNAVSVTENKNKQVVRWAQLNDVFFADNDVRHLFIHQVLETSYELSTMNL